MTASASSVVVSILAAIILATRNVNAQIPAACADDTSLMTMTCCPNDCGQSEGRGTCTQIDNPHHNTSSNNVRDNWPHYYTRACTCNGNYSGVDCSRCKYGYYGPSCAKSQVLPRRSIQDYTQEEIINYHSTLKMARLYDSGYKVVVGEYPPGTPLSQMSKVVNVKLYTLFIWEHHYAAKDNDAVDYAHESTGFLTWHRQFILWLEWEIQYMLKNNKDPNYHMFRLPYWDWRKETLRSESEGIFTRNKLGIIERQNGQALVTGELFDNSTWNTFCWYDGSGRVIPRSDRICDPDVNTGPLLRCPSQAACDKSNKNWPTSASIDQALEISTFDTSPYNEASTNSFRNLLEGFEPVQSCESEDLCSQPKGQRSFHNAIHIILGLGNSLSPSYAPNELGVMADVAASPNDPIFINHHAMIDCILEMWLQKYPNVYPDNVPANQRGHQKESYLVPFLPLFKHEDMMMTANNFGYSCSLSGDTAISAATSFNLILSVAVGVFVLMSI